MKAISHGLHRVRMMVCWPFLHWRAVSILFLVTKSGKVHKVKGDLQQVPRLVESSTKRLEQFTAHEPEGAIVYIAPESVESIRKA